MIAVHPTCKGAAAACCQRQLAAHVPMHMSYLGIEGDLWAWRARQYVRVLGQPVLALTLRSGADTSGISGRNGRTRSSMRNPAMSTCRRCCAGS